MPSEDRAKAGKSPVPRMKKSPRISLVALKEVETALREYIDLVVRADLSNWAKTEYVDRADQFVRWLKWEFEPGSRGQSGPRKKKLPEENL